MNKEKVKQMSLLCIPIQDLLDINHQMDKHRLKEDMQQKTGKGFNCFDEVRKGMKQITKT